MFSALFHSLLFAQAVSGINSAEVPIEQARIDVCLDKAREDPATAIAEASTWLGEVAAPESSYPQQCLGYAYTLLLRWDAAESTFLAAREAELEVNRFRRAQLAAMAGNAALADNRSGAALAAFGLAATDAAVAGDAGLRAIVETDRARAMVMQGSEGEAEAVLAAARSFDAQNAFAWLLSATLARRLGKLDEAQGYIETAAALSPDYPEVGLEAGVIAMLQGREDAARASWESVVAIEPGSEAAATARSYLAQLAELAAESAAAE
jgi:tetratricopeptide (TPR) repeat protein